MHAFKEASLLKSSCHERNRYTVEVDLDPVIHGLLIPPLLHLLGTYVPFPRLTIANIIAVVILGPPSRQCLSKGQVHSSRRSICSTSLRYAMLPYRLRMPSHQHQISTSQRQLDRFDLASLALRGSHTSRSAGLAPQVKVTPRTQRQRRNSRIRSKEAFIIAVVGNTIGTGGIVVDQTKVVRHPGKELRQLAQGIEAGGQGTRHAAIAGRRMGRAGLQCAGRGEEAGGIEAEDGSAGDQRSVRAIIWFLRQVVWYTYYRGVVISVSRPARLVMYLTR